MICGVGFAYDGWTVVGGGSILTVFNHFFALALNQLFILRGNRTCFILLLKHMLVEKTQTLHITNVRSLVESLNLNVR